MARKKSRQAKLARKSQNDAKKERRQQHLRRGVRPPSLSLLSGLDEAEEMLEDGELEEAVEVLEELRRRYPRRIEVMLLLLDAYQRLQDMWSFQDTCQKLLAIDPDNKEVFLALATVSLLNGQRATALRAFEGLLDRWPDDTVASDAQRTLNEVRNQVFTEIDKQGLSRETGVDILLLHDEINLHLNLGNYEQVFRSAEKLLKDCPHFAPALNNRSLAQFMLGRFDLAIADARRVLEFDPGNFHALSNLTRFLFLSGQFEEAREVAGRLKIAQSDSAELYVKQAEALAFVRDWPGILESLQRAETSGAINRGADMGLLYHLAGVAAAELGQPGLARKYWKRAVKLESVAEWAEENLDELKLPIGERNGPWAFPLSSWIPQAIAERLVADMERTGPNAKDVALRRRLRKFLEENAYLERLVPVLLERGDSVAREFIIRVVSLSRLPSVMSALQEFAFGQRGSDQLRYQAALSLVEAELLPPGKLSMWRGGKREDVMLTSFEITPEPLVQLPPKQERLAREAFDAINAGDGMTAERLLTRALAERPDDPSMLFNLAIAIAIQGRKDEALARVGDLHQRFPDYSFARMHLAQDAAERRDFDAAHALLEPLMTRSRFHKSEYTALCATHIDLLMAEGKEEGARTWLSMWRDVDPDDRRLQIYDARLRRRGSLARFFRGE